ncbi:MAG: class IV adenylate cyclase [Spirochaetes bacterium]|nr:class IV adenylate cyclase [Spirochaetota bacterium]
MNYEIELKAYYDDENELRSKLKSIGAVFSDKLEEEDIYFSHPSRDFAETGEAFRLRKSGNKYCFTYKGPRQSGGIKIREEIEFSVGDYNAAYAMVEKLSFIPRGRVKKIREMLKYSDFTICLDDVEEVGKFIEIEKIGSDKIVIEKEILSIAEKLGLTRFEKRSYLTMLMENTKK